MIFKLALRNIRGAGLRSIINVFVVSLVIIGMIWMQGMYEGWMRIAERQMREWEFSEGQWRNGEFDRFDPFSWDNSFAPIPAELESQVARQQIVPILVSAGAIYPEGRMMSVMVKGIPREQTLLKIPTNLLKSDDYYIPVIIGKSMAKSSHLKKGDTTVLRWKDAKGAFNAADIRVAEVMNTPVPSVDVNQIWLDLEELQKMKELSGYATLLIHSKEVKATVPDKRWTYETVDFLLTDLKNMMKNESIGEYITYAILLFMAMVAIFDTLVLAVFKRRKEIGTFSALGMTRRKIIAMFTLEGMMYSVLATALAGILGMPLYVYFGLKGWDMSEMYTDFEIIGIKEPILFVYTPLMVIGTILFVWALTALVSWLPTLQIARMKPTDALRGSVQ